MSCLRVSSQRISTHAKLAARGRGREQRLGAAANVEIRWVFKPGYRGRRMRYRVQFTRVCKLRVICELARQWAELYTGRACERAFILAFARPGAARSRNSFSVIKRFFCYTRVRYVYTRIAVTANGSSV